MYSITQLRKGRLITIEGDPYKILEYSQKQLGRGGSIVNVKLKNLRTGSVSQQTYQGNDKIAPAELDEVNAQYLYHDDDYVYVMRMDTFEQIEVERDLIEDELDLLREGLEVAIQYFDGKAISVELPMKVEYEVVQADPNVKGDTTGTPTKNCRIETGRNIIVPIFIEEGDRIRVDTRSGDYIERV